MSSKKSADDFQTAEALRAFESQALICAKRFIPDAQVRKEYVEKAREVSRETEIGKTVAVVLKERGIPLDDLVARYATDTFKNVPELLTATERDVVALKVVAAAGRTNGTVNSTMRGLGMAGRSFWVMTALVAAYEIGTAKNKVVQAAEVVPILSADLAEAHWRGLALGSVAGPTGAVGGLIIGGILGAAMADEAYVEGRLQPAVYRVDVHASVAEVFD